MNRTTHLNSIRILPALAFCFVVGASTLGAQVVCGDIITTPAELTADLICDGNDAGPALTVMGPGGKLDLNGFTVDCDNDADATDTDGIVLTGRKALVHSGTVTDCTDGVVLIAPGHHHVANITSELNSGDGFRVPDGGSNRNKLNANTAQDNGGAGFHVGSAAGSSSDNSFVANLSDDNGGYGLRIWTTGGGHKVNGNTFSNNGAAGIVVHVSASQAIHGNTIFSNGTQGIGILAGGRNVITENMIDDNGTISLASSTGLLVRGTDDNRLEGNIVTGSRRGIDLSANGANFSTDNRIEGNTVTGNTVDMSDASADCDNNKWKGNTFNTSNKACIN